jgi:hypothetical protein
MFCSISNFLFIFKNLQPNLKYLISLQPARNDCFDKSVVPVHYRTNNSVLIHQRFVMIIRNFIFTVPEDIDNYNRSGTNILDFVLSLCLFFKYQQLLLHLSLVTQCRHLIAKRARRMLVFN